MSEYNYFSISEFSKEVNKTPQAIYKRLSTDLKPFLKEINGKKYIHFNALELFNEEVNSKPVDKDLTNLIEILKTQLSEKDKQIEQLQRALDQQQQLQVATIQTFKALPSAAADENETNKKHRWWSKK